MVTKTTEPSPKKKKNTTETQLTNVKLKWVQSRHKDKTNVKKVETPRWDTVAPVCRSTDSGVAQMWCQKIVYNPVITSEAASKGQSLW